MKKILSIIVLGVLVACLLCACGGGKGTKKYFPEDSTLETPDSISSSFKLYEKTDDSYIYECGGTELNARKAAAEYLKYLESQGYQYEDSGDGYYYIKKDGTSKAALIISYVAEEDGYFVLWGWLQ